MDFGRFPYRVYFAALMGSRGYGSIVNPDSDYDIFVVAEVKQDLAMREVGAGRKIDYLVWPPSAFRERLLRGRLTALDAARMRVYGPPVDIPRLTPAMMAQYRDDCLVIARASLQSPKPSHLLTGGVHVLKSWLASRNILPPIRYKDVLELSFPPELGELQRACADMLAGKQVPIRRLIVRGMDWVARW